MFGFLYEWIQNIAFYMVLATVLIQILPDNTYKKYIRFFTGMILILLLMTPVLKIFGMEESCRSLFTSEGYKKKVEEIRKTTEYLNEVQLEDYTEDAAEAEEGGIEVEEIRVGN